jgi:transcriptional regulator with XRE-family HTH domain
MEKAIHQGRNIKRFREMLGIKQEQLAHQLGEDWNQKKVSLLENKEDIEPAILEDVAKALKVPVEAIRNFDEDTAIHNIQNNYDNSVINGGPTINYKCTIDPLNKLIEVYERIIQEKNDEIEKLRGRG